MGLALNEVRPDGRRNSWEKTLRSWLSVKHERYMCIRNII
jgi:hypothetical protein